MAKYRKKPVVIDAEQWEGHNLNCDESLFHDTKVLIRADGEQFVVDTPEGLMIGKKGDFLIRGIKGELYPCKAEIFAATYEPVQPRTTQP